MWTHQALLPSVRTWKARTSGKGKGGGLILYVNNRWYNPVHITVKGMICNQDVELLVLGLRAYYVFRHTTRTYLLLLFTFHHALYRPLCVTSITILLLQTRYRRDVLIHSSSSQATLITLASPHNSLVLFNMLTVPPGKIRS